MREPDGAPRPLAPGARLLLAAGGLGYAPVAPGTAGSLGAAALWLVTAVTLPGGAATLCALALLALGTLVTLAYGGRARGPGGTPDPGWVVSDEVAGQGLALAALEGALPPLVAGVAAFLLFRALDVLKPWPVARLERIAGGLGVLADDLAAGALAGGLVYGAQALGLFAALG